MTTYISPVLNEPQADANGVPLVSGKIFTYLAGSSTPAATYTSSAGTTPQANPITLNARGAVDNPIWLTGGVAYKFVLTDANLVPVNPGFDSVQGVNDPSTVVVPNQWVPYTAAPTFISTTSFSLVGDQTGTFEVQRRVKAQCSGGTVYATIATSVFAAGITTLTLTLDTALPLDSGLSAVSYGLLTYTNRSVPRQPGELIGVRVITSTQVYTPTAGTTQVIVLAQGGGGGGGGTAATGAGQQAAGGGGGAGGWALSYLTSGFSGVTATIGAAGAAISGANGGNGGTTSFGGLLSATGGTGGGLGAAVSTTLITFSQGSVGGLGSGNMVSGQGGAGGAALYTSTGGVLSGAGGMGYHGAGGSSVIAAANGNASNSPGGGGSGSAQSASGAAAFGGAGAAGRITIWEYA